MGRSGATTATVVILIASVCISCSASWPVSSASWESTESTSEQDDGRFDNFLGMKILKREAALPPGYFQSQAQGQSQQPSGGYSQSPSTPSLSYGAGLAPSLAQGPVIENLPPGQNEIFSSLTSSSPDMFYFSPRDQVLYKVSRLPIDSFNGEGGAAGLSLGATGATATTPATPPTPAPVAVAVQSNTPPPSPFEIGFEVEEETGGEYVGGFGASSSTTTTTPAPPVAPAGAGTSGTGGGSVAPPSVENSSFMTQLINAAAAARPPTPTPGPGPGPGPAPGLVMPALVEAMTWSGSGYRSKDTDDVSAESEYGYTPGGYGNLRPPSPSSMYGSQTEQFSQVVLPPQIRISPELSEYLTRLRNQNSIVNSGSGRNSVLPSSALPENLDAATGTPGQQQRRVRKRMNFKAGGAIG